MLNRDIEGKVVRTRMHDSNKYVLGVIEDGEEKCFFELKPGQRVIIKMDVSPKVNWNNRKNMLTEEELDHIENVAGCKTFDQFQNNIQTQEKWRKENPHPANEPCWDCRFIARKLGMEV